MDFHLSPYDYHWTAFITQPSINMSNPDDLKSIFEDPSDIEMEDLPKPKCTHQLKQSFQSLKSTQMILWQQISITSPTVVSQPLLNDIAIPHIIPTDPLFSPHLQPQRPYHLGEDITVVGRGTHFVWVEARDHNHYWITCQVDYTGVEFTPQVNWGLMIDPNPQYVLSWLDWVGSLMQLWWGQLSEFIWWSWMRQYWWLRKEMRGRGKHRDGLSGMSSEGQRIWNIKIDWEASSCISSRITSRDIS